MNFLKNLSSKIALGSQKKNVRVLEDHLEKGKAEPSNEHDQQNKDHGESSKIMKPISEDDLASIRRGYTTDLEDSKDVKILHTLVRIHWTDMVVNIIALHKHYLFKTIMFGSTYIYYIGKLYQTIFLKFYSLPLVFFCGYTSDICHFLNLVCVITIFFWKKLHLHFEKINKKRLVYDGIICLPFHTFFLVMIKFYNIRTIFNQFLLTTTFLRLYYIEEFFGIKTSEAGVKHWNYFVARYISRLVLITHTLACVLYSLACPNLCDKPRGWAYSTHHTEDNLIRYLYSFFTAFISLSNSGFNVYVATNLPERLVITLTMCAGFVLTTLILIGALSLDLVNRSYRLANMRIQLYAIRKHLSAIRMSRKDTAVILNYYRLFWKKKKGVKMAEAINILPLPLQMEISFDINYYLLQCSILFRNKPEPFLRTLSLNMKHEFFQAGEDIFVCNTNKNKMICVASGIIEVTSDEDYESPIISFGKGSVLGEACLILNLPAKTTVRAANYCELQVLYKADFIQIIHLYPEIFLQLRENVLTRIDNFRMDEDRVQESSQFLSLNLYVSQKKHLSAIKRLKKRLLKEPFEEVIPKNHHACDLYKFAENVKKMKGRYIFLTDTFPWILAARSLFMNLWQIVVFVDVLIVGGTYPYFVAYYRYFPPSFTSLSTYMEVIYFIDIYILLTTAVESKDYVAKKFSEIMAIQLQSFRFYAELVATIPFELMFFQSSKQVYVTIKLNRLLKCFRVCTFFERFEKKVLTHNILLIRLIKYFTYIVIVNYWFGILLYSSTCFNATCTADGWYRVHVSTERKYQTSIPCSIYPTLMATYFGLTVLSTLGFNDIVPNNNQDLMIVILGTILGIFLFGYCTSELSATISYYIQMKVNFQSAMFGVEKYLMDNKMNVQITERVMKFFELQWNYNKGVSLWDENLLNNAPSKLQDMVIFKECRPAIANCQIFSGASSEYLDFLAKGAEILLMPPGEMVLYAGKYTRDVYIIQDGYCNAELEPGCSITLGPGDFIGIRTALLGGPQLTMISTITHVKFLLLCGSLFQSAAAQFPDDDAIYKNSIPSEDKKAIAKLLDLWRQHEQTLKQQRPSDKKRKVKFREWFSNAARESFIWVPDYCERNGENYGYAFDQLGYLRNVKYLLVPICILPQGAFLKLWVLIRYTSVFVLAILVPYQQVKVPHKTSLDHIMIIFDLIAYVDLYLMLFVGFYGPKKQLIIHPCKTAKHYLKGPFILDLIFCFPWELILSFYHREESAAEHVEHFVEYRIRLLKIFQVYRLPAFFNHIEKNIRTSGLRVQIIKFLPFTLICLNACAAMVVASTCRYLSSNDIDDNHIQGDQATPPGMGTKKMREFTMFCHKDCWIERSKYQSYYQPSSIYMLAFYFSTGNLVGLGFGDLTAQQADVLIMVILMMICGTFFFGYVFAYTASYTSDIQSNFSVYQGMLTEMRRYFQTEMVAKRNQNICLHNATYRWSRSQGIEANKILSIVHPALHGDAAAELYQHTLELIPLFEGVDPNFFRVIGVSVRERYYTRGTYIFREDDVIESLYIVHRGKVEIKFYHNFHEEMVTSLGIGGIIGSFGKTIKTRMVSTAMAMVNLDLLQLKTDEFNKILNRYADIRAQVDEVLAAQKHTDFCMPLAVLEQEIDSILDLPETTDEEADSMNDVTSSEDLRSQTIDKRRASGQTKFPTVIESEYKVLLFIFSPTKWFKMSILPESKVLYIFVILCVAFGYIDTILITYMFAFQDVNYWAFMFDIATDLMNIWYIFFQIHTAYLNRFSDYVTDCKKIKERYFANRKRRAIDFLANTPIAYLAFWLPLFVSVNPWLVYSIFKQLCVLRLVFIREFFNSNVTNLMVDRLLLNVLSTLIWLTLAIHLFSCVWYLVACPIFFCYQNSWVEAFYHHPVSQVEVYLLCVYFITGVVTNTGQGDILPNRYEEIILLIGLMLMVKFLIGIFIGISTNIVSLHSSFLTRYEAGIYELRDYLMNENVSDHQMMKMWNYVKQLWAKRRGRQMPQIITDQMSYTNQCAVKFDVYGEKLKKSYLFHDLQECFLRQLAYCINPVVLFPGNYIVQHGDSDQSMYLIHRGEVDVLTVHANLTETIHDVLRSGEMFGLAQGLFYGIPHHFSYRAKTTVDIGIIKLKEWEHLLQYFPGARDFIYKRAYAIYSIL